MSDTFDAWLAQAVESEPDGRWDLLKQWEQEPWAQQCHPSRAAEYLIPIMTVVEAAGSDVGRKVFSEREMEKTRSAVSFG